MIKVPQNRDFKPDGSWCLDFNGTDADVTIPAHSTIGNLWDGGGYCGFWFQVDAIPGSDRRIINKINWWIGCGLSSGTTCYLRFRQLFSTTNGVWRTTNLDINFNQWHFAEIVYNTGSVDNDPVMYIDGVSRAVTETTTPVGTRSSDNSQNLILGAHPTYNWTDCKIANVVFSDNDLSGMKLQYKRLTGREPGLRVYWPMWEGAGASIKDIRNNNTGTITNATWARG